MDEVAPKRRGRPPRAVKEGSMASPKIRVEPLTAPNEPESAPKSTPKPRFTPIMDADAVADEIIEAQGLPKRRVKSKAALEADEYAREIIESGKAIVEMQDRFKFPEEIWPEGWQVEWKAMSVAGKESINHMNELQRNHWRFVPGDQYPEESTEDPDKRVILRGGQVLMMIPKVIYQIRSESDKKKAADQLEQAKQRLGEPPEDKFGPQMQRVRPRLNIEITPPIAPDQYEVEH